MKLQLPQGYRLYLAVVQDVSHGGTRSTSLWYGMYPAVVQRITYDIDPRRRFTAKAITLFYEISTCDLYIVSAFTNKYLKPKDYLSLSFGVKLQLL